MVFISLITYILITFLGIETNLTSGDYDFSHIESSHNKPAGAAEVETEFIGDLETESIVDLETESIVDLETELIPEEEGEKSNSSDFWDYLNFYYVKEEENDDQEKI